MRTSLIALLLVVACGPARTAARWVALTPHDGAAAAATRQLFVAPVVHNGTILGPLGPGAASRPDAFFYVAQWSNPQPLTLLPRGPATPVTPPSPACFPPPGAPPPPPSDGVPVWSIANDAIRVCFNANATAPHAAPRSDGGRGGGGAETPRVLSVQLAQNGAAVPCGVEYDLFLSPNGRGAYPAIPAALGNEARVPLANVTRLRLSFGAHLQDASWRPRCGGLCGPGGKVDYAYVTLGVPLSNPFAGQTIFFQILLFDTREAMGCPGFAHVCDAASKSQPPGWYFSTLPTLGVTFPIGAFVNAANGSAAPAQCLRAVGDRAWWGGPGADGDAFNAALLAALRRAVRDAAGKFGADEDAAHWGLDGWYLGAGLQGSATPAVTVQFEAFEAELGA